MVAEVVASNREKTLQVLDAMKLAKRAMKYKSRVHVATAGQTISAASFLDLMELYLRKGEHALVLANGEDEKEAVEDFRKELQKMIDVKPVKVERKQANIFALANAKVSI